MGNNAARNANMTAMYNDGWRIENSWHFRETDLLVVLWRYDREK
jgi:hypothetical protein